MVSMIITDRIGIWIKIHLHIQRCQRNTNADNIQSIMNMNIVLVAKNSRLIHLHCRQLTEIQMIESFEESLMIILLKGKQSMIINDQILINVINVVNVILMLIY